MDDTQIRMENSAVFSPLICTHCSLSCIDESWGIAVLYDTQTSLEME